ncbi:PREDICTED: uncharacterized protein LOC109356346 [Lupinus angustifolius]|nr:PREDICTED: uncharacterized protein LOC109356346 [Lupinus angustifolius]
MTRSPCEVGDEDEIVQKGGAIQNCEFCGKEFKSGKALGVHKKIHFEAHRNLKSKKGNCNGKKFSSLMPSNRKLRLSCYVCNKDFPSEKSLCGHMRTHPNRDWRGVHPPGTTADASNKHTPCFSDSKVQIDDDNYVGAIAAATASSDASRCLTLSWKKTNKRSGRSVFYAEVVAAAKTLVSFTSMSRSCEAIEGIDTQVSSSNSYARSSCFSQFDLNEPPYNHA